MNFSLAATAASWVRRNQRSYRLAAFFDRGPKKEAARRSIPLQIPEQGKACQLFQSLITTPGITPAFTQVRGETRCCINVRDRETNQSTEFLEPGNPVSQGELERFLADYQSQLEQAEVVAISGSMPKGVPGDFYATLCRLAKAQGKKVIVDSSGSALREALPGGPDLVKPNDEELCQLTGQDTSTVEGCIQAAQSLRALGAGAVAVSRGKDGVLVVSPQGVYQGRPPRIQVVNTVGCGDSMVAGFATGFAQACRAITAYGTTHADYFYGDIPCTRSLRPDEMDEYERNTGRVINETFEDKDVVAVPACLVANHGVFAWGKDAAEAVYHATVVEEVAKMAFITEHLAKKPERLPAHVADKHYFRKHGKNAYYGQDKKD